MPVRQTVGLETTSSSSRAKINVFCIISCYFFPLLRLEWGGGRGKSVTGACDKKLILIYAVNASVIGKVEEKWLLFTLFRLLLLLLINSDLKRVKMPGKLIQIFLTSAAKQVRSQRESEMELRHPAERSLFLSLWAGHTADTRRLKSMRHLSRVWVLGLALGLGLGSMSFGLEGWDNLRFALLINTRLATARAA